jgi:hypothetical protein
MSDKKILLSIALDNSGFVQPSNQNIKVIKQQDNEIKNLINTFKSQSEAIAATLSRLRLENAEIELKIKNLRAEKSAIQGKSDTDKEARKAIDDKIKSLSAERLLVDKQITQSTAHKISIQESTNALKNQSREIQNNVKQSSDQEKSVVKVDTALKTQIQTINSQINGYRQKNTELEKNIKAENDLIKAIQGSGKAENDRKIALQKSVQKMSDQILKNKTVIDSLNNQKLSVQGKTSDPYQNYVDKAPLNVDKYVTEREAIEKSNKALAEKARIENETKQAINNNIASLELQKKEINNVISALNVEKQSIKGNSQEQLNRKASIDQAILSLRNNKNVIDAEITALNQEKTTIQNDTQAIRDNTQALSQRSQTLNSTVNSIISSNQATAQQKTNISDLTNSLSSATIALTGLLTAFKKLTSENTFINTSSEYEIHLRNFNSLAQETEEQLALTHEAIKSLATEDQLSGMTELAKALQHIESSNFHAADAFKILESSNKAAKAGLADLFKVVDAGTSILKSFGYEASKIDEVNNINAKVVQFGKITMDQLNDNVGTAILLAKDLKVTYKEIAAAISTVTSIGIKPETATTLVNNVLKGVMKPSVQGQELADSLGITMGSQAFEKLGFGGVVKDIFDKTKQFGNEQESVIAKLLGDLREIKGLMALNRDEGALYNEMLGHMSDNVDQVSLALEQQTKTFAYQKQALGDVTEALNIEFGTLLQDTFTPFLKALNDLIKYFLSLPEPLKKVLEGVVLLGGGIVGLTIAIGGLAIGIDALGAALARAGLAAGLRSIYSVIVLLGLPATLGVFALIGAAIITLGAIVYTGVEGWKAYNAQVENQEVWDTFNNNVEKAIDNVKMLHDVQKRAKEQNKDLNNNQKTRLAHNLVQAAQSDKLSDKEKSDMMAEARKLGKEVNDSEKAAKAKKDAEAKAQANSKAISFKKFQEEEALAKEGIKNLAKYEKAIFEASHTERQNKLNEAKNKFEEIKNELNAVLKSKASSQEDKDRAVKSLAGTTKAYRDEVAKINKEYDKKEADERKRLNQKYISDINNKFDVPVKKIEGNITTLESDKNLTDKDRREKINAQYKLLQDQYNLKKSYFTKGTEAYIDAENKAKEIQKKINKNNDDNIKESFEVRLKAAQDFTQEQRDLEDVSNSERSALVKKGLLQEQKIYDDMAGSTALSMKERIAADDKSKKIDTQIAKEKRKLDKETLEDQVQGERIANETIVKQTERRIFRETIDNETANNLRIANKENEINTINELYSKAEKQNNRALMKSLKQEGATALEAKEALEDEKIKIQRQKQLDSFETEKRFIQQKIELNDQSYENEKEAIENRAYENQSLYQRRKITDEQLLNYQLNDIKDLIKAEENRISKLNLLDDQYTEKRLTSLANIKKLNIEQTNKEYDIRQYFQNKLIADVASISSAVAGLSEQFSDIPNGLSKNVSKGISEVNNLVNSIAGLLQSKDLAGAILQGINVAITGLKTLVSVFGGNSSEDYNKSITANRKIQQEKLQLGIQTTEKLKQAESLRLEQEIEDLGKAAIAEDAHFYSNLQKRKEYEDKVTLAKEQSAEKQLKIDQDYFNKVLDLNIQVLNSQLALYDSYENKKQAILSQYDAEKKKNDNDKNLTLEERVLNNLVSENKRNAALRSLDLQETKKNIQIGHDLRESELNSLDESLQQKLDLISNNYDLEEALLVADLKTKILSQEQYEAKLEILRNKKNKEEADAVKDNNSKIQKLNEENYNEELKLIENTLGKKRKALEDDYDQQLDIINKFEDKKKALQEKRDIDQEQRRKHNQQLNQDVNRINNSVQDSFFRPNSTQYAQNQKDVIDQINSQYGDGILTDDQKNLQLREQYAKDVLYYQNKLSEAKRNGLSQRQQQEINDKLNSAKNSYYNSFDTESEELVREKKLAESKLKIIESQLIAAREAEEKQIAILDKAYKDMYADGSSEFKKTMISATDYFVSYSKKQISTIGADLYNQIQKSIVEMQKNKKEFDKLTGNSSTTPTTSNGNTTNNQVPGNSSNNSDNYNWTSGSTTGVQVPGMITEGSSVGIQVPGMGTVIQTPGQSGTNLFNGTKGVVLGQGFTDPPEDKARRQRILDRIDEILGVHEYGIQEKKPLSEIIKFAERYNIPTFESGGIITGERGPELILNAKQANTAGGKANQLKKIFELINAPMPDTGIQGRMDSYIKGITQPSTVINNNFNPVINLGGITIIVQGSTDKNAINQINSGLQKTIEQVVNNIYKSSKNKKAQTR